MDFWGNEQFSFFESILFSELGCPVQVIETQFISGGDINTAAQVFSSEGVFFIKWNTITRNDSQNMFQAEAQGLALLRQTGTFHIPKVIGYGQHGDKHYLILEYIDLGKPDKDYWQTLGQSLAALHVHTQSMFGLNFDNFIGSLPQNNTQIRNGYDFFFENRLMPQAGLAMYKGILTKPSYEALLRLRNRLPDIVPNERPALLHGDLWSGNVLVNEQSKPALVDPAVYYGFREAELAYTHLFAGFDAYFYDAYDEAFPLHSGFNERIAIYNLYPLLVHVNLFGSGYVSAVERVLKQF